MKKGIECDTEREKKKSNKRHPPKQTNANKTNGIPWSCKKTEKKQVVFIYVSNIEAMSAALDDGQCYVGGVFVLCEYKYSDPIEFMKQKLFHSTYSNNETNKPSKI